MSSEPTSNATAGPSIPKGYSRTTKETHPNLPPGLILDAEGKVCKVCNSWRDWGKLQKASPSSSGAGSSATDEGTIKGKGKGFVGAGMGGFAALLSPSSKPSAPSPTTANPASSTSTVVEKKKARDDCPPDTVALGRSTWAFLHTTAAYYPIRASPSHQLSMLRLLRSVSLLYPCAPCADDFQSDLGQNPPDLTGREGLSRWLCERHNTVNRKLGKEEFECSWERLDGRWKDGPRDGSCD